MKLPNLDYELNLWKKGYYVCGIDEVGRGSFAGPLVAAGVIIKPNIPKKDLARFLSLGITDSKLLSPQKRQKILDSAREFISYSTTQYVSVEEINEFGIGMANKSAFLEVAKNILRNIKTQSVFFLTDYFPVTGVSSSLQDNIVRGDRVSVSIALASIVAKVERDNFMKNAARKYSSYGFEENNGYGTLFHRSSLKLYGPSAIHRTKFIRNYV